MTTRLVNHLTACLLAIAATSCGGRMDDPADNGDFRPAVPDDQPDTLQLRRPTVIQPTTTNYTHDGQQRVLRLINALAGHEITGRAPSDLARETECTASTITRDLANLKEGGFAEMVPETGLWRLSPQIVQIGLRHMTAIDRAKSRLDEIGNRFSRQA